MRRGDWIPRYFEILRQYVSCTKGNDAQGHARAGDPLNDIKDSAIAAADDDGIKAFCYCPLGLGTGSTVFTCLQKIDRDACLAEDMVNALDISAPCSRLLQHGVDE